MNLTTLQYITLFFWSIFSPTKYNQYEYYLNIGLQAKYAFEKAQES